MRARKALLLLAAEGIALIYFSVVPGSEAIIGEPVFSFQDLVMHFIAYAIFGFLINRVLSNNGVKNSLMLAIIMASLFGAFIEVLQWLTPTRDPSYLDIIANVLGAVLGSYYGRKNRF